MAYAVGDWVEVLSTREIFLTLDEEGRLDGLPFMPEMRQMCGRRFRVSKSAHKTCDTIYHYKGRRLEASVHLEDLRCSGAAHGGCQAECLLFWKEAWIKRVDGPSSNPAPAVPAEITIDVSLLERAARRAGQRNSEAEQVYSCQATRLVEATTPLKWWSPGQYLRDVWSRNVSMWTLLRFMALAFYNMIMRSHWRGRPYPSVRGLAVGKTPTLALNLQPGELVQVRSKDEIMQTINGDQRNRGLWFDVEMLPFCGKTLRVRSRVERIINEQTGVMMNMKDACIILEGGTCSGCYSRDRMFCPRGIFSYWREIWLRRVV